MTTPRDFVKLTEGGEAYLALYDEIAQLRKVLAELKALLKTHGRHTAACASDEFHQPCDCGLESALSGEGE